MAGLPRSNWNTKRVDGGAISNISIKAGEVDLEFTTGPGGLELGPAERGVRIPIFQVCQPR